MSMDYQKITEIKARKVHICQESGAIIRNGETYLKFTGVYDGDFYHTKMHAKIAAIYRRRNEASNKRDDEGIYFGELAADIYQALAGGDPDDQDILDAEEYLSLSTHSLSNFRELLATIKS